MTDTQNPVTPTAFGLASDTGGKDFGIFLPMANGGWILSSNTPKLDGSYDYNLEVAKLAEASDFDFIMAMAKYRGYGGETRHWNDTLDSPMLMAALSAVTERVRVVATIHTLLQNAGVAAKTITTLDKISHGRAGLNVVTGSYKGEFAQMGAWPEEVGHDARYDLADEWITGVRRLWTEDSVTLDGKYVQLEDCMSDPKPEERPFLVCAGTSPRGMKFTAEHMDAIFLSGRTTAELARATAAAKDAATAIGRYMRVYTMVTLVIDDTDEAAQATAEHYRAGLDEEALKGMFRAYGFLDSEMGKENDFTKSARSGFMSTQLIGSAETVTAGLIDMIEQSGIDGMMLIFPDYITGIKTFAEKVQPALKARFGAAPDVKVS
ncbi:MAG: LLM class flavin-dependent oxidoreductase [Asticcacaulis sp.]